MTALAPERPVDQAEQRARPLAAVLAAVGIPIFMVTLDNLVVTTALPVIRTSLDASITDLQWFVNAYTLPFAAFLLTAAALGDRHRPAADVHRRHRAVHPGLGRRGDGLGVLAAHRGPRGAGHGRRGGRAAVADPARPGGPGRMRNAAVGIWGGISGLGVAVGPVVGGAVVEGLDWSWIFWLNVPVGVIAVVLAATVLPRVPRRRRQARPARPGALRLRHAAAGLGRRGRAGPRLVLGPGAGHADRRRRADRGLHRLAAAGPGADAAAAACSARAASAWSTSSR